MTASPFRVSVPLTERSYEIAIGPGLLSQLGRLATAGRKTTLAFVLTDSGVLRPHAEVAVESLQAAGVRVELCTLPAGEPTKSVSQAAALWQRLFEAGADRKTLVVAIGGGVVGDLAGFVAATYARGLDFYQVPTSLVAQVDSSVGGKTGVNLPGGKNLVGAFWQPIGVLIDPCVLQTLPEREYLSGLAEVVKYGVILDAEFFLLLEHSVPALLARDAGVLQAVVARCCELKAQVVAADERETTGLRAVLNYGHTFGHAFEAVSGYGALLHGEAVAIGMQHAARLAARLGRIDDEFVARQQALLEALHLPTDLPPELRSTDVDSLLRAMQGDKKTEHGRLRFVLPTRLGHVELVAGVPEADVRAVLAGG